MLFYSASEIMMRFAVVFWCNSQKKPEIMAILVTAIALLSCTASRDFCAFDAAATQFWVK